MDGMIVLYDLPSYTVQISLCSISLFDNELSEPANVASRKTIKINSWWVGEEVQFGMFRVKHALMELPPKGIVYSDLYDSRQTTEEELSASGIWVNRYGLRVQGGSQARLV